MKSPHSKKFSANVITLAVRGALISMCAAPLGALAQGEGSEAVNALTQPANTVEIGVENTSKDSAKFGEYNGLNKKGAELIGNFKIRGGDAYHAFEGGNGINRWEVKGIDLGTTSRELGGTVSNQGKWSLGIGYDELRHSITDSYQTPFQGLMGGNGFTLPTTFGVINTTAPGANGLTPAQQASFQKQDVHSDRKNASFNAKYIIDSSWDVKFDFNHLAQSGAKLLGVAGEQAGGPVLAGITWAGQTPLVLMNPTNYTTDNFNLALNWGGEKGHVSASYFGSMFRDGYNGVSFNNPFVKGAVVAGVNSTGTQPGSFPVDTMSTMPGNNFNQLNLSGGYAFTSATKLTGGLSYDRNIQNEAYSASGIMAAGGLPQNSLNGLVVSNRADLKLTNQTTTNLLLSAGLKYKQRDNRTASSTYTWSDINEVATSNNASVNTPMSNKKTQFELAGDYRINQNQKLRLSYENEQIRRWCNNAAANNQQGSLNAAVTGVSAYYAATCAQVPDSKEDKLAANYKLKASEDLSFSAGYAYSKRKSDISLSYYNPMQAVNTPAGTGSVGEGFNVAGFMASFQASRKEQLYKAGVNWQANEKLSLGLNSRYTDDKYDSTYGVQNGKSWSLNLDTSYNYDDHSSVFAYATTQNSSRDLTDLYGVAATTATATRLNIPVGATWSNRLKENDTTIGLGTKKSGLMGGKVELGGDLTYTLGKSGYGTQQNFASADLGGNTCGSAFYLTCGDLPDIRNELLQLKLGGGYKIDKASKVMLGYMYQRQKSSDYFYNAYQFGATPTTLLLTNQQAPNHSVNVVSASYIYTF